MKPSNDKSEEHYMSNKDRLKSIEANVEFITEAAKLLPENMPEETRTLWAGVPERVKGASELNNDATDRDFDKGLACIEDATSKYANQIAFFLFRGNLLSEEMTEAFRKLRTPEQTTAELSEFEAAEKAEEDELLAKRDALITRQDNYELIQAVLGGYTVEEARKKQAENKAKIARAMGAK